MEQIEKKYSNGEITVYWKPRACIHSSVCYTRLLEVFNPRKRPWVNMQGAPTQKIIDVVNKCPTDALTWKWDDEKKNETIGPRDTNHIKNRRPDYFLRSDTPAGVVPAKAVSIRIMKNGPLLVEGSFIVTTSSGSRIKMANMTSFCRCGRSGSMPFCDGSHRTEGFKDSQ